jgi:hypothetical protein
MPAGTDDVGQRIDVTVKLDGDAGNDCQGDVLGTIALTLLSSQDTAAPHSITD